MDKEEGDSDGSISWEDFFGSSTDLVPSLLNMYDILLCSPTAEEGGGNTASTQDPPIVGKRSSVALMEQAVDADQQVPLGWRLGGRPLSSSSSSSSEQKEDEGGLVVVATPKPSDSFDSSKIIKVSDFVGESVGRGGGSDLKKGKFCDLSYMDRVVMEIVETERVYVNDLREIISGYLQIWMNGNEESLQLSEIKELFSNIEEIYKFNSEFLSRLELCGLDPVSVAACFVEKNEGFSIYTQYCTNYPRTMSILSDLMGKEGSARCFRERQLSLGQPLPLGSYLLKPVQRILKYHLLLQNIVKHHDEGLVGHGIISSALSAMTNIAHHINEMKRRHEHAVRVQEIQSLLYGWEGEDLTTYGELCAEGTFRAFGAKALRHVFLFDKMVLITKKKEDGILCYKSHIMCSNLMLIESVPGEPLSFHVIPFDNPRLQCTLQGRNLEQKREWTLELKRVILENYHAVIPIHARQLVMELGQHRPQGDAGEKVGTKRQHSAPEYLEKRKGRKSESTSSFKARLKRGRKSVERKERRSRKNSEECSRERSKSGEGNAMDRKMSSASCPPSTPTTSEKKLVKKLSGWRRKSEPGIYGEIVEAGPPPPLSSQPSVLTINSSSSIEEELEETGNNSMGSQQGQQDSPIQPERRESIEEIVGQLVMQNREFQRILSKQRTLHIRKTAAVSTASASASAAAAIPRTAVHQKDEESDTETEEKGEVTSTNEISSDADPSILQLQSAKNVQRTVSDPGSNKVILTPRRGPYDPLSLFWSSFRRNSSKSKGGSGGGGGRAGSPPSIRHTHSFSGSRKEEPNPSSSPSLPHGDSGVFASSDSSTSSSEANIPTLPAVWLKQQESHLAPATPNKSGSLPRSFQVGLELGGGGRGGGGGGGGRDRERPITIASDQPNYNEMDHLSLINKFSEGGESGSLNSMENLSSASAIQLPLHPDHRIYHPSKPSIKHMLLNVTNRLAGLKLSGGSREHFGSISNISSDSAGSHHKKRSLRQRLKLGKAVATEQLESDGENCCCESVASSGFGGSTTTADKIGARLADHEHFRPRSSASASTSCSDEKSWSSSSAASGDHYGGSGSVSSIQRRVGGGRKGLSQDLYLSYIDQDQDDAALESDGSADSFYERSFEAIESLLESELFPDSAIYSADDGASTGSSCSAQGSSWALSSVGGMESPSISMLAARLSNTRFPPGPTATSTSPVSALPNKRGNSSRLIKSQAILEKLQHLEQCSRSAQQFHASAVFPPSFEGMKSIQERREELELWKQRRVSSSNTDEYETSSQHSTSTINTVIEASPHKDGVGSRRASGATTTSSSSSSSSGANSPMNGRAAVGVGDQKMPKGWVKLVVGKLQGGVGGVGPEADAAAD